MRTWSVFSINFLRYDIEMCGNFNAKIGREDILKPLIGDESLHKTNMLNDIGVSVEALPHQENHYNVPTLQYYK